MAKLKQKTYLFVSSLSGGGSEKICVNLAVSLAQQDIQVVLIYLYKTPNQPTLNIENLELVCLNSKSITASIIKVVKYFKQNNVSKVISFKYEIAAVLVLLKKARLINCYIIARNNNKINTELNTTGKLSFKKIKNAIIKFLFCRADFIVHQCEVMFNDFTNQFNRHPNRDIAIYNPIQQKLIHTNTILFKDRKTNPYFLCVGRLAYQKNFGDAINGFAKLIKDNQVGLYKNIKLKVVGSGDLLNKLEAIAKQENIYSRVEFLPYQDPEPLFKNALATILTSHYEGFPNVMLESLAYGTPVVAYDFDYGPRETIINGVNGFVVPQYNINHLSNSFEKIINTEFSTDKIQQSIAKHSKTKVLNKWIGLIEETIY